MNYYLTSHIPMVKRVLGSALKGCVVEQGLGGAAPGTTADFLPCCATCGSTSVESFQTAFGPVAAQIQNDVANYSRRGADHSAQRREARADARSAHRSRPHRGQRHAWLPPLPERYRAVGSPSLGAA